MSKYLLSALFIILVAACRHGSAQLLENDTLYIGDVIGHPGEQVFLDVTIKSSVDYAGWQIPIVFGHGDSPVFCDSVSLVGSIMADTIFRPGGWDFVAPHVNNNEWNNIQTCGVAGIVWMTPPTQDLPPGDYQIMRLFFTISDTASTQTIVLDTVTAAWYDGGPPISYLIVVPPGYSRITHVVKGAIHIVSGCTEEKTQCRGSIKFEVQPTIIQPGAQVTISHTGAVSGKGSTFILYDASGRHVAMLYQGSHRERETTFNYVFPSIARGVYFIVVQEGSSCLSRKVVVQ